MAYTPIDTRSLIPMPVTNSTDLHEIHWTFFEHELAYSEYYEDYEDEYEDIRYNRSTLINSVISMPEDDRFETILFYECTLDNILINCINTEYLEFTRTRITDILVTDSRAERIDFSGHALTMLPGDAGPQYSVDSFKIDSDSMVEYMFVNNVHIKKLILDFSNDYDCLVIFLRKSDTPNGTISKIDEIIVSSDLELIIRDFTDTAKDIVITKIGSNIKDNVRIVNET